MVVVLLLLHVSFHAFAIPSCGTNMMGITHRILEIRYCLPVVHLRFMHPPVSLGSILDPSCLSITIVVSTGLLVSGFHILSNEFFDRILYFAL